MFQHSDHIANALGRKRAGVVSERDLVHWATILLLNDAYVLDPGDEVLVPSPSYPLFDYLAALDSVRVLQCPLVYHGSWNIDFDALARFVTSRTRAVVLVNPNNPTGSFLKRSELGPLLALCRKHHLALISDEVFADYAFHDDPRLVRSLTGRSEVSGMTGLYGAIIRTWFQLARCTHEVRSAHDPLLG